MNDPGKSAQAVASGASVPVDEYRFGSFRLDVAKRRLWKGEQLVPLTPKAFDTLLALLRHSGQVVDRDDLLQIIWPDSYVTEETLTQNIAAIRRALGDSSERPEYIATVPRRGYQFIGAAASVSTRGAPSLPLPPTSGSALQVDRLARRPRPVMSSVAALVVLLTIGLGVAYYARPKSPAIPFGDEWQINPPPGTILASAGVLSPDGRTVAFATIDDSGTSALWVQALGSLEPHRLPDTAEGREPFWSPDGKALAFLADRKLKRIGLTETASQTLADVAAFEHRGGAWSGRGGLLYAVKERGPLWQLGSDGSFHPVTRLAAGERLHVWPCFLPDGRHFLYRAVAFDDQRSATYLATLDSTERVRVLDTSGSAALYAPPGYLLSVREGALVAQRFVAATGRLEGPPVLIAANVAPPDEARGMTFSVAGDVVSYVSGGPHDELVWFDRGGRRLGVLPGSTDLNTPTLSPDETEVLAVRPKPDGFNQIWIAPTTSGAPWRFDTGLSQGGLAVWSHDGRTVAFTSAGDLYRAPAGGGTAELLMRAPTPEEPLRVQDWSRDDRFLVYYTPKPKTGPDLWWFSIADRHAEPFLQSTADEAQGQLSPDGKWIAYTSNESGPYEVWVRSFPSATSKHRISTTGGAQPQWRREGRELFYLSLDNTLMSVEAHIGPQPTFGAPRPLFHIALNESLTVRRTHYAVSRDGRRFLFSAPRSIQAPITVRLKWTAALPH